MVAYTVRIDCPSAAVASDMLAWLVGGHAAEVCAAGALRAEVVVVDGAAGADGVALADGTRRIECRYLFASRDAFAAYERDHAPRLRADGLRRFPAAAGVRFERSVGDVAGLWPAPRGGA